MVGKHDMILATGHISPPDASRDASGRRTQGLANRHHPFRVSDDLSLYR
jgi:hypothetical protein